VSESHLYSCAVLALAERFSGGGEEVMGSTSARVWSMRRTSARTLSSTSWKAPWCHCGCPGSRRNASRCAAADAAAATARTVRRRRRMGGPMEGEETLCPGSPSILFRERGRGRRRRRRRVCRPRRRLFTLSRERFFPPSISSVHGSSYIF
jgi:hypothetical protein